MARVTVYDVAEKAGVSTATVSFAFRHPDKVKDDTKAKVLRVAEELGYVPSGNARSLAKGRTVGHVRVRYAAGKTSGKQP